MRVRHLVTSAVTLPILFAAAIGHAQSRPTPPIKLDRGVQPPDVKSPEILPDGRVTFRVGAPNATSVVMGGELITQANAVPVPPGDMTAGPRPEINFTKNASGVWEGTTTQKIRPGAYRYFFVIDGAVVLDPRNVEVSPQGTNTNSLLLVPGDFSERRKVPHGSVLSQAFVSSTLNGAERPVTVYTPPGYEKDTKSYPVLYLMHGGGDHETSWITAARAHDILDNLFAEGKATPMIVVMPLGRATMVNGQMAQVMTSDPSRELFVKEMMTDIIPWVERTFRTIPGADHRAMAGLSMGGIQTLNVGLSHLDAFRYLGVFGSGWFSQADRQWFYDNKKDVIARLNDRLTVFDWSWGAADFAKPGAVEITDYLKSQGVRLTTTENQGGHDWRTWREDLHRFAQMIFR
jgi:enterochelin esterase family protein